MTIPFVKNPKNLQEICSDFQQYKLKTQVISCFFFYIFLTSLLYATPNLDKQDAILHFWFGHLNSKGEWLETQSKKWFRADPVFDEQISLLFGHDIENASLGKYSSWCETPRGRLALILLLDQFPRNIYRGTPNAFAFDSQALQYALEGLTLHQEEALFPIEQLFFFMPLMHSEKNEVQNKSVALFEEILKKAPENQKEYFETTVQFAKLHKQMIDRFGHFPHRSVILKRELTADEEVYLRESNQSFGQD